MAWIPIPGVDPRIQGRWINLSPQRRFVCDLLHFSRAIPSVPTERRMRLADVIEARGRRPDRNSWCAIFIKAYGIVAAARPELRRAYLPMIWPHLYEHPINVASFSLERTYRNEPGVFFARIARPEEHSLRDLDAVVRHHQSAPVETVPTFTQALWISRLPRPLRRLVWAIGLYSDGACGQSRQVVSRPVYREPHVGQPRAAAVRRAGSRRDRAAVQPHERPGQ